MTSPLENGVHCPETPQGSTSMVYEYRKRPHILMSCIAWEHKLYIPPKVDYTDSRTLPRDPAHSSGSLLFLTP
ncbi:MAG: hypothetical protein CSA33_02320 [Desulfobulbus propionicus]|nr:MAG: hypothetical protein CSA33_02320 [Desulfobulbus propionicus]